MRCKTSQIKIRPPYFIQEESSPAQNNFEENVFHFKVCLSLIRLQYIFQKTNLQVHEKYLQ